MQVADRLPSTGLPTGLLPISGIFSFLEIDSISLEDVCWCTVQLIVLRKGSNPTNSNEKQKDLANQHQFRVNLEGSQLFDNSMKLGVLCWAKFSSLIDIFRIPHSVTSRPSWKARFFHTEHSYVFSISRALSCETLDVTSGSSGAIIHQIIECLVLNQFKIQKKCSWVANAAILLWIQRPNRQRPPQSKTNICILKMMIAVVLAKWSWPGKRD